MTTIASPTAAIAMIAASTETSVRFVADSTCGARIATSDTHHQQDEQQAELALSGRGAEHAG